jgi:hypothetical protein
MGEPALYPNVASNYNTAYFLARFKTLYRRESILSYIVLGFDHVPQGYRHLPTTKRRVSSHFCSVNCRKMVQGRQDIMMEDLA